MLPLPYPRKRKETKSASIKPPKYQNTTHRHILKTNHEKQMVNLELVDHWSTKWTNSISYNIWQYEKYLHHHNDKTKGASTTSFEHRVGAAKCPME
jgi:hypothetical protein